MIAKIFQLGSLEAITRVINWGMLLLLPLLVSESTYGEISLFLSFLGICAAFLSLGLNRAILRFHSKGLRPSNVVNETIFIQTAVFFAVFILLSALDIVGDLLPVSVPSIFFYVIVACAYLQNLLGLGVAVGRVEKSQRLVLLFRLLPQLLQVILLVTFLRFYQEPFSYIGAIWLSLLMFASIGVLVLRRQGTIGSHALSIETSRKIAKLCWPFIFVAAASYLHAHIDKLIIAHYLDAAQVGIYTFYYTLGASINFVFAIMMFALEADTYEAKSDEVALSRIRGVGSFQLAVGMLAGIAFTLFGEHIFSTVYPPSYFVSFDIAVLILVAHAMHPMYLMGNMGLLLKGKTHVFIWGILPSAICNIVMNLLLIPRYGIKGAAIATLFSYLTLNAIVYGCHLYSFRKSESVRHHLPEIFLVLVLLPLAGLSSNVSLQIVVFAGIGIFMAVQYRKVSTLAVRAEPSL